MAKEFNITTYPWRSKTNYRLHPEDYRVGKGEQGVLICEPYKSKILPYWRFRTPLIASRSSRHILQLFYNYLSQNDFVGADIARKFLQMGFTRSRRYANYKGGQKYNKIDHSLKKKGTGDPQKIESADIFYKAWQEAEAVPLYASLKAKWKIKYG